MTPLILLARVARLIPPPRIHLTSYHGVLAAPTRNDAAATAPGGSPSATDPAQARPVTDPPATSAATPPPRRKASHTWAMLTDRDVIRPILERMGEPCEPPPIAPARIENLLGQQPDTEFEWA